MGIDYDAGAFFGWRIEEDNLEKFSKVVRDVLGIKLDNDFVPTDLIDCEVCENLQDVIRKQCNHPCHLDHWGNFYTDDPEGHCWLFGNYIDGKELAEIIDWFNTNKELLLKIEEIMGDPPRFISELSIY